MATKKRDASEHARKLGELGAKKGGRARASVLSAQERQEIARRAIEARWRKEKGPDYQPPKPAEVESAVEPERGGGPGLPFSMFTGRLEIGDSVLPCHVLNNGLRVLTHRGMVDSLGMARGGSGNIPEERRGDRLGRFVAGKALNPFISSTLMAGIEDPIKFKAGANLAYGYEATVLVDLCEAVLKAREAGKLQKQQEHIAKVCEILMRSFAKVGIIALVDEATGFQKYRAKKSLQLKLQAFIAEEMQEWARMFPEEFWFELARMEGIHYSPRHRPLRWGKYVMAFVYDSIDRDVGKRLREINPDPHFRMNHHQWLKQFGRDRVNNHLQRVIAVMKLCNNMDDFQEKFARVFAKSYQFSFNDIDWNMPSSGRSA
jgi:hypothetical protein